MPHCHTRLSTLLFQENISYFISLYRALILSFYHHAHALCLVIFLTPARFYASKWLSSNFATLPPQPPLNTNMRQMIWFSPLIFRYYNLAFLFHMIYIFLYIIGHSDAISYHFIIFASAECLKIVLAVSILSLYFSNWRKLAFWRFSRLPLRHTYTVRRHSYHGCFAKVDDFEEHTYYFHTGYSLTQNDLCQYSAMFLLHLVSWIASKLNISQYYFGHTSTIQALHFYLWIWKLALSRRSNLRRCKLLFSSVSFRVWLLDFIDAFLIFICFIIDYRLFSFHCGLISIYNSRFGTSWRMYSQRHLFIFIFHFFTPVRLTKIHSSTMSFRSISQYSKKARALATSLAIYSCIRYFWLFPFSLY
jgi:hypothetical protein